MADADAMLIRKPNVAAWKATTLTFRQKITSNLRSALGPEGRRLSSAGEIGVIHPIPVPFMDQDELRKGRIARRPALDT